MKQLSHEIFIETSNLFRFSDTIFDSIISDTQQKGME